MSVRKGVGGGWLPYFIILWSSILEGLTVYTHSHPVPVSVAGLSLTFFFSGIPSLIVYQ